MGTRQLNLKISEELAEAAERFAKTYGYRNIQELAAECMREKIFEESEFDETFTEKEIELIEALAIHSIKNDKLISEEELFSSLK